MAAPPVMQAGVLRARRAAVEDAQRRYRAELVRLRDECGWTWGQFAAALGMSRQGAAELVGVARRLLANEGEEESLTGRA